MRAGKPTRICELPWKPGGLILDPYAGSRCWWKGSDCNVVFVDRYFPTNGCVVADATSLPFADGTFDSVCADPPHWIHAGTRDKGYFGMYPTRDALRAEWSAVALELHRVTKTDARLIWKSIDGAKIAEQCCNVEDLMLSLTPYWNLVDALQFESCVSWSSALTVWTLWQRR